MATDPQDPHAAQGQSTPPPAAAVTPPGLVHAYLAYDPKNFPSPTTPPPDLASAALEHLLAYGSLRELTPEELARAIRIDPAMFPQLGPSLESLRALLEQAKAKILSTYDVAPAKTEAQDAVDSAAGEVRPPPAYRDRFIKAINESALGDLEDLWSAQRDEHSPFARAMMKTIAAMGDSFQVQELAARYTFTGRTPLSVPDALAVKQELEEIDKLLQQLAEAKDTGQLGIIDLSQLAEYADQGQLEQLNELQRSIEDYLRQEAERQGIERASGGLRLTPKALRLFQGKLLAAIFADMQAARSGRHAGPPTADGAVEIPSTAAYQFGDPVAHLDLPGTLINAAIRKASADPAAKARGPAFTVDDMQVHRTRTTPKAASVVLMDMSGSMRHGGQYIQVKRMALALDALIRTEYPGDVLRFVEMSTFTRLTPPAHIPALLPKPVSIHRPVVRLKVDMSDPNITEAAVPQHFTNIQRALQQARTLLAGQPTPNRQIMLITDGLPTAHTEGSMLYLLYPPDPRTEAATLREAALCAREGVTINVFLLPSWSQSSEDIAFAHRLAQSTRGRVLFTGGRDLDRFVLWDYVAMRRRILA